MTIDSGLLRRIAEALERMAPEPARDAVIEVGNFFLWNEKRLSHGTVGNAPTLPLDRFVGVDSQIEALKRNFNALAAGIGAHDMLLWGARGMGKSALLRSISSQHQLAMVQTTTAELPSLPYLFEKLAQTRRAVVLFIDDLAFAPDDPAIRTLRSLLDGGVSARPDNVRLAVTSNHRHLLERSGADPTESRHARDTQDDQLALVDRFGLVLGFHAPDQETYLEMVRRHLAAEGLGFVAEEAIAFALQRGGRSGRTAWHFRTEIVARQPILKG